MGSDVVHAIRADCVRKKQAMWRVPSATRPLPAYFLARSVASCFPLSQLFPSSLSLPLPSLRHSCAHSQGQFRFHVSYPFKLERFLSTMDNASELPPVPQQKRALRSEVRKQLKAMTPSQRAEQDIAIQNIILAASWFKSSRRLCAYVSCDALREVDTSKILSAALLNKVTDCQMQKRLYVPRVEDKNAHMRMLRISSMEDLLPNAMNILEPTPIDADGVQREDVMEATDPVDLILLPGLAFDKSGRRLGRGGGYYDVFLKTYQELAVSRQWERPLLVALAYTKQILGDGIIPVTRCDYPVDALVSPEGVICISSAASQRMF